MQEKRSDFLKIFGQGLSGYSAYYSGFLGAGGGITPAMTAFQPDYVFAVGS